MTLTTKEILRDIEPGELDSKLQKEKAKRVEKACNDIMLVDRAASIAPERAYFNHDQYEKQGRDQLIGQVAEKYKVNPIHIKNIVDGTRNQF